MATTLRSPQGCSYFYLTGTGTDSPTFPSDDKGGTTATFANSTLYGTSIAALMAIHVLASSTGGTITVCDSAGNALIGHVYTIANAAAVPLPIPCGGKDGRNIVPFGIILSNTNMKVLVDYNVVA